MISLFFFLVVFFYSTSAFAYIDPGLIAGLFNFLIATISAFFVLFVFRPINFLKELFLKKKELIFKKKDKKKQEKN
jgi:hypothetical protein